MTSDSRLTRKPTVPRLVEQFEHGLDAPICLTWELTYACNLACVHCLSSSGKRDPRELSTQQCKDIIDELERMQVFYVNIGGGEPTVRPDFWELVDYATAHHVGVKFSTNGVRITPEVARAAGGQRLRRRADLAGRRDRGGQRRGARCGFVRDGGARAGEPGRGRLQRRQDLGRGDPPQRRPARRVRRAGERVTAPRCGSPGCGRRVAAPTYGTSCTRPPASSASSTTGSSPTVMACSPGDSFFHLSGLGAPGALAGLNLCGAGRVVCLIDPIGDVYACPFAIHDRFLAGNILSDGGFRQRMEERAAVSRAAGAAVGGRVRKLRPLRQLPRRLHGGQVLHRSASGRPGSRMCRGLGCSGMEKERVKPKPSGDHSRGTKQGPIPLKLLTTPPARLCNESPV